MGEEGGDDRIGQEREIRDAPFAPAQGVGELELARFLGALFDCPPILDERSQPLAHEAGEEVAAAALDPLGREIERLELLREEAQEAVAADQRVVGEDELVLGRERLEPERELGELDRRRVLVHPEKAAGGDQPLGVEALALVGRDRGRAPVPPPGLDEPVGELTAGLDQKGARAHGRVEDHKLQDPLGPSVGAQPFQDRAKGFRARSAR